MSTVWRVRGLSRVWSHNFVLGYTDTNTVMLDFDHTTLETVIFWSKSAKRFFKLGGFLVLESSEGSYHVVFNRAVSWADNLSIVASIAIRSRHRGLKRWLLLQCRKKSMTLRVSPKGTKQPPKLVHSEGKKDEQIREYVKYRSLISEIIEILNKPEPDITITTRDCTRA
jgi:hypothetical protein